MNKSKNDLAKDYGGKTFADSFTPTLEDYFRTTVRYGLAWDFAWFYATVTTAQGKIYNFCRGYEKTNSTLAMNTMLTNDPSAGAEPLFKRLFIGMILFEQLKDQEMITVRSIPAKHNFQFNIEPGRFHWQEENGELDLQMRTLGPALWFFTPGAKIKEDVYYTSELCRVTGTVMGEAVSGFGGLDQTWMPIGMGYIHGKLYKYLEESWISWANSYADGTYEYGVCFTGFDQWSCVFYCKNGESPYVATKQNDFSIQWTGDGVPQEVLIQSGPHHFKWTADARATELKEHMQWATGRMINLARNDTPVKSFSTNEYRKRS